MKRSVRYRRQRGELSAERKLSERRLKCNSRLELRILCQYQCRGAIELSLSTIIARQRRASGDMVRRRRVEDQVNRRLLHLLLRWRERGALCHSVCVISRQGLVYWLFTSPWDQVSNR